MIYDIWYIYIWYIYIWYIYIWYIYMIYIYIYIYDIYIYIYDIYIYDIYIYICYMIVIWALFVISALRLFLFSIQYCPGFPLPPPCMPPWSLSTSMLLLPNPLAHFHICSGDAILVWTAHVLHLLWPTEKWSAGGVSVERCIRGRCVTVLSMM